MPSLQFELTIPPDVQRRIAAALNAIIEAGGQVRLLAMLDDSISLTAGEVIKATHAGEGARAPGNGAHTCPECGRKFERAQALGAHMRVHKCPATPADEGVRAPKLDAAGKRYTAPPVICEHCGKSLDARGAPGHRRACARKHGASTAATQAPRRDRPLTADPPEPDLLTDALGGA